MKILVSGSTGFIGSHLIDQLTKDNHEVVAIIRKLTDKTKLSDNNIKYFVFENNIESLISFIKKEKLDGVIHLASLFLTQHKTQDIERLIDSNVFFATSLLEASVQGNVRWFINTGTFWQHFEDKEYSPVNLYAATKQAFEDIASYYLETSKINFVTLKLSDTYGEGDTRQKIINLWLNMNKTKKSLDMSAGGQLIDISYIDDVINAYIKLMNLLSKDTKFLYKGKSYAVNSSDKVTLKQLSKIFEKVTKKKLNINWNKKLYRPREVMKPWSKGQSVPGWKPKITLEEGMRKMINE